MTTLYRAVSQQEKEDIDAQRAFKTGRNTLEAKQFLKDVVQ
jgi:transposase-like protein